MPINSSIDDLPLPQRPAGNPPATTMIVVDKLAEAWYAKDQAEHDGSKAIPELPFRLSAVANRCDRQMYYSLTDESASNPPTIADSWRMGLGTMVHESLQQHFASINSRWQAEVVVDLRNINIEGSGRVDLYCPDDGGTVVEVKTVNGFSFKMKATTFKGPAEGPQWAHVLQGAIAGRALNASKLIIAYFSMELVGPDLAKAYSSSEVGRFGAEWHYDLTEPSMVDAVDKELARIRRLTAAAKAKAVPARILDDPSIPAGAHVVSPLAGNWAVTKPIYHTADGQPDFEVTQAGKSWFCSYCRWQSTCPKDA